MALSFRKHGLFVASHVAVAYLGWPLLLAIGYLIERRIAPDPNSWWQLTCIIFLATRLALGPILFGALFSAVSLKVAKKSWGAHWIKSIAALTAVMIPLAGLFVIFA